MQTIENHYFKFLSDEPAGMSGLPLPDPDKGPYRFVNCDFHPRLWEALQQMYWQCEYDTCNFAPVNPTVKLDK